MVLARDEWEWHADSHSYRPYGEPWDTTKAAIRRYWELTGINPTKQRFRARID